VTRCWKVACELTTERANPLRRWNPDWGGCSTARRPVAAVNKLFRKRPVSVKVDFEEHLRSFSLDGCAFRPAGAGPIAL
jgi:hypothetical protein